MLERLERADRHTELLALLEVREGPVETLLGRAQHFRGDADAGDIEGWVEHVRSLPHFADDVIGTHGNVGEGDIGGVATVDQDRPGDLDARGVRCDQEQRDAVPFPAGARSARRDDQPVGDMPVENEGLRPRQGIAIPGPFGGHSYPVRVVAMRLFQGKRQQQFSGCDPGQQRGFLRVAATDVQRGAAYPDACETTDSPPACGLSLP